MSNKTQRTAWNLTKMAGFLDPKNLDNGLYEMGHDANMAMIDVRHIGVSELEVPQQFVFVPQKEWDNAVYWHDIDVENGEDDPNVVPRKTAVHWYKMSTYHRF